MRSHTSHAGAGLGWSSTWSIHAETTEDRPCTPRYDAPNSATLLHIDSGTGSTSTCAGWSDSTLLGWDTHSDEHQAWQAKPSASIG